MSIAPSQALRSPSKFVAEPKVFSKCVTLETFQPLGVPLKLIALSKVFSKVVTLDTSQPFRLASTPLRAPLVQMRLWVTRQKKMIHTNKSSVSTKNGDDEEHV